MPITAAQFKGRLAELLDIPKKDADDVLWAFQEVFTETVKNGDSLTIPGVGKLSCIVSPARNARNPRTGETFVTKPKVNVKFNLSASFKENAPSIKSKKGRALLEEAEQKKAKREKAKRKREREAEKSQSSKLKKSKKSTIKTSDKKVKKKKSDLETKKKKADAKKGKKNKRY